MSNNKEANARIKINKLLVEAGWRFDDTDGAKANIHLENYESVDSKEFSKIKCYLFR